MLIEWFHFYASLKPKDKLCLRTISFLTILKLEIKYAQIHVSFFNKLDIEKELCSQTSVSFFNELDREWELCSLTSISFFNELDT